MLKKILSPKTCAQCRLCCKFDRTDTWEIPVFDESTADAAKALCPDAEFTDAGSELTFKAPILTGDELFPCPALTDNGCGLSAENKPFDCKIWPFRMMRDDSGNTVIALSELCTGMSEHSDETLRNFLTSEGLDRIIFEYASIHPSHIKPLAEGYRVII